MAEQDLEITGIIAHHGFHGAPLYRARSISSSANGQDCSLRVTYFGDEETIRGFRENASFLLTLKNEHIVQHLSFFCLETSKLGGGRQGWLTAEYCEGKEA